MVTKVLSGIFFVIFLFSGICFGQYEIIQLPEFTKEDRVLVLAPHPDDEAIGAAGIMQKALKAGAKVKVTCYTNGDNNELAFIVYEKRLVFKKRAFLYMGEVRKKESQAAMNYLGLGKDDVVFLGYPDFGTMEIFTKYWGDTRPFRSMLTRVTKVSYPGALSVGAPYAGESILKDIKKVITDFKPTKIFVSHPADNNRDHRSLYLFLRVALWDLEGKLENDPEVFPYIIHVPAWPKPRGYYPNSELMPPDKLQYSGIIWQRADLTEGETRIKHNTVEFYKSQIEYNPPYLFTFARKDEIFGDYPEILLRKQKEKELIWQGMGVPGDIEAYEQDIPVESDISAVDYARDGDALLLKLTLRKRINKNFGLYVYLMGYSKHTEFSRMPKINISINLTGMHVKDKKTPVITGDIKRKYSGRTVLLRVPLSRLGNPGRILTCVKTQRHDFTLDEASWRVLELE